MTEWIDTFHFLRPAWLLMLLPIMILTLLFLYKPASKGQWQDFIAPEFHKILLTQPSTKRPSTWPIWGASLMASLLVMILSGPSWQQVNLPIEKNRQASVIVLDLSLSMLADDMKPNRITRVRFKLEDYLKQNSDMPTGMVGYSATTHTITPISEDNSTLLAMLPSLSPLIMPAYGSEPLMAFQKALELFDGAEIHARHLLWVTDDIETDQIEPIQRFFQKHEIELSMLLVGTKKGGVIKIPEYGLLKDDKDRIVISKQPKRLLNLAETLTDRSLALNNNHPDLSVLSPSKVMTDAKETESEQQQKSAWLDEGAFLLALIFPLLALGYRKGWLFSVLLLPSLLIFSPDPIMANDDTDSNSTDSRLAFTDYFKSPNLLGYEKWVEGNYAAAQNHFESLQWRAATAYRMGEFEQAAKLFALDPTVTGQYNLGNAYAKMGKFEAAKNAYQSALSQQPDFAAAQKNLKLMEQLLSLNPANSSQQPPDQTESSEQSKTPNQSLDKPSEESQENANDNPNSDTSDQSSQNGNYANEQANQNNSQPANNHDEMDSAASDSDPSNQGAQNSANNAQQPNRQSEKSDQPTLDELRNQESVLNAHENAANNASKMAKSEGATAESTDPSIQDTGTADRQKQLTDEERLELERLQSMRHWLDQIPDEPGLFLENKFRFQFQNQPQPEPKSKVW